MYLSAAVRHFYNLFLPPGLNIPRNSGVSCGVSWICEMGQFLANRCKNEKEKDPLENLC